MLLEFAIGNEIKVFPKENSGLNSEYSGILLWPRKDGVMSISLGNDTLDIPYTAIDRYDFLGKTIRV
jgi:hypothetical protein